MSVALLGQAVDRECFLRTVNMVALALAVVSNAPMRAFVVELSLADGPFIQLVRCW